MANDAQGGAKISGYLEKKGKIRMVSSWKKYWFVLEGRLLLYYRSKVEYEALGPCKGSITLGTPCNIKPALASSCVFQIETRSNTVTLRAESRYEQDKWMQAILAALNQTGGGGNGSSTTKMSHFRYSADDLVPTPTTDNNKTTKQKPAFSRQNTMPERLGKAPKKDMLQRLQMLGAQSYGGSLQTINKLASSKMSPKLPKNDSLKRLLQGGEAVEVQNTLYATVDKSKGKAGSNEEVVVENDEYAKVEELEVENEAYVEAKLEDDLKKRDHIYQEIADEAALIVENSEYCSIGNEDKCAVLVDHNENETSTYVEPIYQDSKIYDVPEEAKSKLYDVPFGSQREEIKEAEEVEPDLPPRPKHEDETSSQSSTEKKGGRMKRMAQLVKEGKKKDGVKRSSFVVRMLKKMRKDSGKEVEVVAPVRQEEVAPASPTEVQILGELQRLLDNKKHIIEEKLKSTNSSTSSEEVFEAPQVHEKPSEAEVKQESVLVHPTPCLPPKQKYLEELIDYNNQLVNGNAVNIPRPKLRRHNRRSGESAVVDEKLKTIDEILDDLESHQRPSNGGGCRKKVKELIVKFNENSFGGGEDEEVEMRRKSATTTMSSEYENVGGRHSDDLSRLLEELSKVTNAPIMMPGVTSSLVTTPLTNEEWKNLVPIRKRRFSEPDYDIPRPHSSLQIIPSSEKCEDNPMKPTRFFGPVLLDQETSSNGDANERNVSITPDSLEMEQTYQNVRRPYGGSSVEEDRSLFSYTSHIYGGGGEMRTLDRRLTKEEIRSRPKSLTSDKTDASLELRAAAEEYVDSLEPTEHLHGTTTF